MSTVPDAPAKSPEQKDSLMLGVELYPMILEGEKSFPNGDFTGVQELYDEKELLSDHAVLGKMQALQQEKESYGQRSQIPFFISWRLAFLFSRLSEEMREKIRTKYENQLQKTA